MSKFVIVQNARGQRVPMSVESWKTLASLKEPGKTRKGWTLVEELGEGVKTHREAQVVAKKLPLAKAPVTSTFKPEEVKLETTAVAQPVQAQKPSPLELARAAKAQIKAEREAMRAEAAATPANPNNPTPVQ